MPPGDSLRINRIPPPSSPLPPLLSPSKPLHPSPSRWSRGEEHRGATQVQIGDSGPRPYTKIDPPAQSTGRDCCPLFLRGVLADGRQSDTEHFLDLCLDLEHDGLVVAQEHLGVLASLPDALVVVAVPGAGLLNDP